MREVFLGRDARILLEEPRKRIILTNPNEVEDSSTVWKRLLCTMGKCEFEMWLAEEIVNAAVPTDKNDILDLSYLSGVKLQIIGLNDEWQTLRPVNFLERLKRMPIFQIVVENDEELVLKYI